MAELEYFQKQVGNLLYSTYEKLDDLRQEDVWKTASVLIENGLKTRPIEDDRFVVRYVSIEPTDHLKAISEYENKFNQKYDASVLDSRSIVNLLLKESMIELMPKTNLKDRISFNEFFEISNEEMSKVGKFYAEPIVVGSLSEEPRYKQSLLRYTFEPEGGRVGYVIIAESPDGRNFNYPKFGQYSAPTMLFDLFHESNYHLSVLGKIHSRLENLNKK